MNIRRIGPALALLAAAVAPACSGSRAAREEPAAAPRVEMAVRRAEFRQRFLMTGELQAVRSADLIVPRTPNWEIPIRWMETDGTAVKAGQKVVEFDNQAVAGGLEEKELAASQSAHELEQRESEAAATLADKDYAVESARIALEKARISAEVPEDILPQRTFQERQLEVTRMQAAYDKAVEERESAKVSVGSELEVRRIALEKARREIGIARRAIEELVLTAPRDGILVVADNPREGRKLQVGDTAWVGLTVARIPDLTEMQVEGRLSDVDEGRVARGMAATCTLDTYPDLPFPGRIVEIAPVAQEADWRSLRRGFRVRVALDRADPERMRPGMSVRVEVEAAAVPGLLLAPRGALDLESDPPRARMADGTEVEVKIGACNAEECVVEGGLDEGTRLRARG